MTEQAQTAILGAGVMGETLLSGLVRAGRRPARISPDSNVSPITPAPRMAT